MSEYGWVIDVDYVDNEVGNKTYEGPRNISSEHSSMLTDPACGERFRMYDDDDVLYYEGRIVGDYSGFEPLEDFGMGFAGAVRIDYFNPKTNEWKML